jgi:hypothetical protein
VGLIQARTNDGLWPEILSLSTPGVPITGTGEPARKLARALNEYFANATSQARYNSRLGFFGNLPDWQDVNGTLRELDFLDHEQRLCTERRSTS